MIKLIASSAIRGAHKIVADAERVRKAIRPRALTARWVSPTRPTPPGDLFALGRRVDTSPRWSRCWRSAGPAAAGAEGLTWPYLGDTLDAGWPRSSPSS